MKTSLRAVVTDVLTVLLVAATTAAVGSIILPKPANAGHMVCPHLACLGLDCTYNEQNTRCNSNPGHPIPCETAVCDPE